MTGGLATGGARMAAWARRAIVAATLILPVPGLALDSLTFSVPGADRRLRSALIASSLLAQAEREQATDPLDLFAAARSDYARLLGALYAEGHYSGIVSILIDGREAAEFPAVDAPGSIGTIAVEIRPGPRFTFASARMRPYARGTNLPPDYRDTLPARSTAIQDAARAGVEGWRQLGHAKAAIAGQDIVADHRSRTVASEILLDAGPRLRFGKLHLSGQDRMRARRIVRIAGYREGEAFDPDTLDKMSDRLRRTGVFRSIVITEADSPNPDGTLDIGLAVVEEAPRRFGFGAEISSSEGASLQAFWLHRNLFGGGEQLRLDAILQGIESDDDFEDYEIGVRIDSPGTPVTDSSAFIETRYKRETVLDQEIQSWKFGIGVDRVLSEVLTAEAEIAYVSSSVTDATGRQRFRQLAFPLSLEWDRRDDVLQPTTGSYLVLGATPFWGFDTTDSGGQFKADARIYRAFGVEDRLVLAGRLQLGTVVGTSLLNTPPDYLFYSGGGGTVRGHPFRSLGVPVARGGLSVQRGGLSFIGLSAELRGAINGRLGGAVFYDAGYISAQDWFGSGGEWQTGAGVGVRYDTGFGPVRLDVAFPVTGRTGDGMQVYIGIGQAF